MVFPEIIHLHKSYSLLLPIFCSLFSGSCSYEPTKEEAWTKEQLLERLDSLPVTQLLAGYSHAEGYTLIVSDDSSMSLARKFTCQPGYPPIVDSLVRTSAGELRSKKQPYSYTISNNEVIETHYQKIIHPSSNWQGQTPWQEIIVSHYPRLDK